MIDEPKLEKEQPAKDQPNPAAGMEVEYYEYGDEEAYGYEEYEAEIALNEELVD